MVSPVNEPLVNLVAEAQCVVFDAEVSDHLQLVSAENLQEEDRAYWTHRVSRHPHLSDLTSDDGM